MYLVTAYFDDKTTKTLKRYIQKAAAQSGNRFMEEHKVPAHMTLASIEARSIEELIPAFLSLEGRVSGCEVYFATVGALLPYVFYTAPVMTGKLMELHGSVCEAFSELPDVSISRFYKPDSYLPHVTIAKTLSKEQMRLCFAAMQESFVPFKGRITEIGLSRVNPHVDVSRFQI